MQPHKEVRQGRTSDQEDRLKEAGANGGPTMGLRLKKVCAAGGLTMEDFGSRRLVPTEVRQGRTPALGDWDQLYLAAGDSGPRHLAAEGLCT